MGLEDQTQVGSSSGPSAASIRVFMPHERPIRVYRGDGDDVEAFIRETKLSIRTRSRKRPPRHPYTTYTHTAYINIRRTLTELRSKHGYNIRWISSEHSINCWVEL